MNGDENKTPETGAPAPAEEVKEETGSDGEGQAENAPAEPAAETE